MTSKGWQAVLHVKGLITKGVCTTDEADNLSAVDATLEVYTPTYPVTDSSYDVSTDETDIVGLYIGDSSDVSSEIVSLAGVTGTIVVDNSAGGANKGADHTVYVSYYADHDLGYAQDISFTKEDNLEAVFAIGSRSAKEIKEGRIMVSGKIGSLYVDKTLYGWMSNTDSNTSDQAPATPLTLPSFTLEISDYSGGTTFTLTNCKLGSYEFSVSEDGFVAENVTFTGIAISAS